MTNPPDTPPEREGASSPRSARPFDLIVLGATGFTGKLVAKYLHEHGGTDLNWAVAGRNAARLKGLSDQYNVPHLMVDVHNPVQVDRLTTQTRALITTVGPYLELGRNVVASCARFGTHYADLTGEAAFAERCRQDFSEDAQRSGARILHACGFEAVPTDLGVHEVVKRLPQGPRFVSGMLQSHGSFSGGTLASALGIFAQKKLPSSPSTKGRRPKKLRYDETVRRWVVPVPLIDVSVVRASAGALPQVYGDDFSYHHLMCLPGLVRGAALGAGLATARMLIRVPGGRRLIQSLRPQGTGPSEAKRAESWFRYTFVGEAAGERVVLRVSGADPGYDETAKFFAETGRLLAGCDGSDGGFHTPVTALGDALRERLEEQGIKFEWVDSSLSPV